MFHISFSLFILLYSCSNIIANITSKEEITMQSEANENQICLKFQFSEKYPSLLKTSKKSIYVGDGEEIYQFDLDGNFQKKIDLPSQINVYVDFAIYEENDKMFYYIVGNDIVSCFDENSTIIYRVGGCGDIVRVDEKGVAYSDFQEYDKINNKVINKIKVIQADGSSRNYPIDKDLPFLNMEIIDSNIMFHSSDNNFYFFPIDQNKTVQSYRLQDINGRVWFLGKSGKLYVFREFNYERKKDVMNFYDQDFKFIGSRELNDSFEDIVDKQRNDSEFLMDNPSAIMYSFVNNNIYYLRNTKSGSCISVINPTPFSMSK